MSEQALPSTRLHDQQDTRTHVPARERGDMLVRNDSWCSGHANAECWLRVYYSEVPNGSVPYARAPRGPTIAQYVYSRGPNTRAARIITAGPALLKPPTVRAHAPSIARRRSWYSRCVLRTKAYVSRRSGSLTSNFEVTDL